MSGNVSDRTSALWRATGLAVALVGAGCTKDPGLTVPSTTGPVVIESFVGTLAVGGSAFYSFTVPQNGNVSLTLLSLTVAGVPATLSINMGLGVPRGTTCVTTATAAVAGNSPQSVTEVPPRVYCVLVTDVGTLTAPAAFAVNIARPR
jgi:hypothetical protein